MKKIAVIALSGASLLLLTGCNLFAPVRADDEPGDTTSNGSDMAAVDMSGADMARDSEEMSPAMDMMEERDPVPKQCVSTAPCICREGELCDLECSDDGCAPVCEAGSSCEVTCGFFECATVCDGDYCEVPSCTAGLCDMECAPGTNCAIKGCNGGDCEMECGEGATCRIDGCTGGSCHLACEAGSTCTISGCSGGGCTFECDPGARCDLL